MKRVSLIAVVLLVAGCGEGAYKDLEDFVKNSGQSVPRRVEPLPEVKPYEAFAYDAFDLPDPFRPRKLAGGKTGAQGQGPDMDRPKEPLEAYPLESLKMVGTLVQKKDAFALIKTPDNNLVRVRSGNYLGQNFGKISDVTEAEVKIKEFVQDADGSWTERTSSLLLEEQEQKK